MSARKEVRFSVGSIQNKQQSIMANSSSRRPLRETNAGSVPSLSLKSYKNIMKSIPPPPPPPPPPRRNMSSRTPTTRAKRFATPPPPPPPPPPPRKLEAEKVESVQRTPAKTQAVLKQEQNFSPFVDKGIREANEMFVGTPVLTLVSPMSGVTNFTDFNSPSLSNHRRRNTILLDTTLNSIDMLNFEYIENSDSIPDLQRIIGLLSESKNKSPHLIKAAMRRLAVVQQNGIASPNNRVGEFAEGTANISRITTANTTLDSIDPGKSSLNFSLSPSSTLQGIDLIGTPKSNGFNFFENGNKRLDCRLGPIAESPTKSTEYSISHHSDIHDSYGTEKTTSQRSRRKSSSFKPLQGKKPGNLTSDSREETTRVSPRIQSKLAPLAAQEIQNLKSSLQERNSDNQELKTAICKATKEHEETRRALQITRATLCRKDEETRALEERLEAKITELSQVLASTAERSKLVVEGERTFRRQCEEELLKENEKNTLLNQELKETRNNLEKLQQRHSSFRVELMRATGIVKTERTTLSQDEFVSALSKKIQKMKEDNDRMTKTLKEAKKAIQQRDEIEGKMNDAIQLNQKLAIENQQLCRKIHELRAEVKSSRAYIDKLLRTSHVSKEEDWEKNEQKYKQVIQNLRKQIRKQDTVVSIDLYKLEKEKARQKATQLRVAESTIDDLQATVAELQLGKGPVSDAKPSLCDLNERNLSEQNTQTPKNLIGEQPPKSKFQFESESGIVGNAVKGDDLTGITITFQKSPELNNTVRSRKISPRSADLNNTARSRKISPRSGDLNNTLRSRKISPRSGDMDQRQPAIFTDTLNTNGPVKEKRTKALGEIAVNTLENNKNMTSYAKGQFNGTTKQKNEGNLGSTFGKENSKMTKNASRGSPLRLVRNFGGRSALKNKIKKMRSPKMSSSNMMSRQVQVILH